MGPALSPTGAPLARGRQAAAPRGKQRAPRPQRPGRRLPAPGPRRQRAVGTRWPEPKRAAAFAPVELEFSGAKKKQQCSLPS